MPFEIKNKHYKIAFCGLGSIGQRHLKNTVYFLIHKNCTFQIDAIRSGYGAKLDNELETYICNQYSYDDEIPNDYDIIFITNPTSLHIESLLKYRNSTKNMFIEKPISDKCTINLNLIPDELVCYVACPLRYSRVLQYLKENVSCEDAYSVRAICSTYLPNWHPNKDYRESYSAHKDMGGGVSVDLIHEWDYLIWLFGLPNHIRHIRKKISGLEIDSEDIAIYVGSSDSKVYELHLDYFGRKEIRKLEIFMPNETIEVDIHENSIYFSNSNEKISLCEYRDEMQLREIEHFFNIIEGKCINDNDLNQAMRTLKIAKGDNELV